MVKSKVKSHKLWIKETDLHLKKYVPIQTSTLVFDSLFKTADTP